MRSVLKEYDVGDGVFVSVDLKKYDVLRVWVVGKEFEFDNIGRWYFRVVSRVVKRFKLLIKVERYKRVVIVIRVKK